MLHLEGKAYDWWFYETSFLNHVNVSTYPNFTRRLVKIFDTSLVELTKPKQKKPLHELEGSINPTPFQNAIEGVKNLQNTLLEARSPLQEELSSQKEDMEIFFSKEDRNKEPLNDDEDRKSTRLNSSHLTASRMPSSA